MLDFFLILYLKMMITVSNMVTNLSLPKLIYKKYGPSLSSTNLLSSPGEEGFLWVVGEEL